MTANDAPDAESVRDDPASVDDTWGYAPDPEDPGSPDARDARLGADIARFVKLALATAGGATLLVAALELMWRGNIGPLARGFALGAFTAVGNLWLLARAFRAVAREQEAARAIAVPTLMSFGLLLAVAFAVSRFDAPAITGFGLGLSIPVVIGLVFALRSRNGA